MGLSKKDIQNYVDKSSNLAENVKRNVMHGGMVDDKTVLALNEFIIAANNIQDLIAELNKNKVTSH